MSRSSRQVPFNDFRGSLRKTVAAVIIETIPATYGIRMPNDGYNPLGKELCERYGALSIAHEVQMGLLRTGQVW
ncbi:aminotransferase class III-fold pyridoxal phosphate-dependent enzyme [Sinorhizobium garamanticum]|uniref:aminotransferase class III-fold pyridoxal phosphate-dependent enzyme n=1 Tax=Sinorhizobium garamanticum TaxID=680247 RepID=UPI003CC83B21